ncbi:hypothetical protein B484DRAFT_401835 [Ochromonadaceae sp. CCMP2298]|nr:hypothetical protein B484DRAFT_401835 [Ochromonadaceae sp. CCMP2298]
MVAGAEAVAREGARRFAGDALQAAAHILAHSRYSIALQSEGLGLFRRLSRLLPSSSLPLPLALLCLLPVELQGRRRPCLLAAPAVGAAQRGLAQLRSARQGHGVREGVLADAGSGEGEGDEDGNAGAGAGMGAEDGTDPTPAPKGSLFYDPFEARRLRALAQAAAAAGEQLLWATGEPCVLLAVLSNPLSVPLSVLAYPVLQGACWVFPQTLEIPPRSRFEVRLPLLPREAGQLRVLGLKLVINNVAHLLRVDEKGRGVGEGQGQGVGQESAGSGGSAGVGAGSGAGAGMGAIPGTSSTNTVTVVPPALPLLLAASWAQVRMEPETEAQVREAEAEVDMQTGAVETGAGAGGLAVVRSSVELALLPGEARTETVFVLLEPLASLALGAGMAMGAGPGVGVEAGVSTTGTSQYPSQSLSLCDFRVTIREVPTCAGQSQGQGKSIGQGQRRTPPAQSLPLLDFAGPLASVEGAEAEVGSGSGSGMGMGMGAGGGCTLVAHRLHTGADKGQGGGEGGRCALSLQLRFQQSDSVAAVDVEVEAASGQLLGLVRALKHMGAGTEAGSGTVGGGADLALLQALAEPGVGAEAGADLRVYSRVLRLRVWLRREPGVQLLQVRALGCRQLPSPHEARALTSALRLLLASTSRFRGVQGQGQGWGQQQQWALTHTSEQRGHGEEKEREKGKEKGKGDCDSGGDLCIRMLSESTDVAIEVANESDWEMQLCVAITTVADARLRLPPPPLLPLGSSGGSGALAFAPQQVMQYAALLGGAGAGTGAGMLTGAEMGTGSLLLLPARSARTVVVRYPTAAPAHAPSSAPGALRVQWSLLDDALPAHVAEEGAGAGTERGAGRRVRSGFVPVPLQLMPAPSPTCPSPSPSPFSFPTPSAYAVQGACQGQSEGQEQGEGQRTGLDVAFSTISLSDTAPLSPTPTPATTPAPASSALTPAGGSASVSVPMTVYGGDLGLQLHRDSPLLRPLLSRMPPLSVQLSFEPAPANAATTKSNAGAGTAGYDAPSLSLPLPLPLPLASVGGVPCFSLRRARFYDVCVSIGATATARAVTDSDAASGAGRASGSGAAMGAPLRLELVLLAAPSEAPVVRRRDQPAARCSPTPTPALPPTSTLEVEEAEAGARLGAGAGAGARHCVFTGRPYAQYTLLGSGSGSSSGSSGSGDGGGNGRGGGCRDVGGDVGSEGMGMVEHRLRVCLPRSGSFSLVAAVRLVGAEAEARGAGTWWTSPAAYVHLVVS